MGWNYFLGFFELWFECLRVYGLLYFRKIGYDLTLTLD